MSTIIRTRSPFFIRTPQESDSNLNYFQAIVTVHGGTSGSTTICDDLYATFTFRKKPLPNETSVTFEISEFFQINLWTCQDPRQISISNEIKVNNVGQKKGRNFIEKFI